MRDPFIYKYTCKQLNEYDIPSSSLEILNELIKKNIINLLLLGESNTGKTSIAMNMIHTYYKDYPRDIQDNVLIINTLKEQGIQYYRTEVKCFCQTQSTIPLKKIILIDDIDTISDQGQQIFLNYIDKYDSIHFIITGTNSQKIIESIHSRLYTLKLLPISIQYLQRMIQTVTEKESILIEDNAVDTLIHLSKRSIGTILNYLEKFKLLERKITQTSIYETSTDIRYDSFDTFTTNIIQKKSVDAIQGLITLYTDGYSVIDILDAYFVYIKISNISDVMKYKMIKVICKYISIFHQLHEHQIELIFFVHELINIT
jgi:DNA polymerase III delta prime subunit